MTRVDSLPSTAGHRLPAPLAGMLLGRPGGQINPARSPVYANALCRAVREEYGPPGLPNVSNVDFGHADPMMVLPPGMRMRIDSRRGELSIREAAVVRVVRARRGAAASLATTRAPGWPAASQPPRPGPRRGGQNR